VPAIQTGLYPTTHAVSDFPDLLPAGATTIAEVFRDAGYATVGFASIPFVGRFTALHQGYQEFHEPGSLARSEHAKTSREYVARLLPWLERHRDVPFFVLLHVADPHSPYAPYAPYGEIWGAPEDAAAHQAALERVRPLIKNPLMRNFGMPRREELLGAGIDPAEFVDRELDAYDGSIRGLDVEIRRLVEQLELLELRDDVLIGFLSDHGTEFLEHDDHFHGHSAYGELNRVPFFLWGPRWVPAGVTLEPTVETIDMMPSLLDLAGLEIPALVQGRSLRPHFGANATPLEPRPAFTENVRLAARTPGRAFTSYAVVQGGWKLIWNLTPPDGLAEYELYDHVADPLNLEDVAATQPERVSDLRQVLVAWRERAQAARLDPASAQEMSAEELERLRALGYVQ
jgi:arylsulfatase A-like enzyme